MRGRCVGVARNRKQFHFLHCEENVRAGRTRRSTWLISPSRRIPTPHPSARAWTYVDEYLHVKQGKVHAC